MEKEPVDTFIHEVEKGRLLGKIRSKLEDTQELSADGIPAFPT